MGKGRQMRASGTNIQYTHALTHTGSQQSLPSVVVVPTEIYVRDSVDRGCTHTCMDSPGHCGIGRGGWRCR